MVLKQPIQHVFVQLSESLKQLTDAEYTGTSQILFNASIGQHVRHIIELFLCLEKGYEDGFVNYENRKRDFTIETNKNIAISLLKDIYSRLDRENKDIILQTGDDDNNNATIAIPSNYYRELAYNLEHSIHHMALIRIGIHEVSAIILPEGFGVAFSTIKHRNTCAQ